MSETDSPSPAPTESTCRLPRSRTSPSLARQRLRDFLSPFPVGELLVPTGELLVSELVTNAVQHARAPRDRLIHVRFHLAPDGTLRIEVHDADSEKPVLRDAPVCAETGRGLLLVHELARSWGCCPREGGIGKFVWCHVSPEESAA
ncbi:ATPase [Kitasatospora xanthocidica]|uniref:ATP-binding protein n=1 Tax=Kitasatospora xanthocidica TaxID=83382 RepID=UPI001677742C|nr:ATP-binding protein [Kitasatospora xanthocidica]GHF92476.1 ATPase [Kitasatospora xanthocidica]